MKYFSIIFILVFPVCIFAQTGAAVVRDYVGLINQSYHPGIVSYFERAKEELTRQGETEVVRIIDIFLGGGFGSGFLYSDERGNFYVITNNHVVAQAYNLSITFERTDGARTRIDNLRIIALDVENDLAILALPAGQRPLVAEGLTFLTRDIQEGEEVFSAGFPGLGLTPLWQFGSGRVSNAFARFPRSLNDETMMGPFVQHTAQIDLGNSGGPLLVSQANAPSGYAVAGINTLTGVGRQAANFAIPVDIVQRFIYDALNPNPETFRAALNDRLSEFVRGLEVNRAVYPHIAEFISSVCIGENAEYAYEEMFDRAGRTVIRSFIEKGRENFIGAMSIAIAWTIEDSIRTGAGALRTSIKEVSGSGEEYTVVFTINNRDVSSVWIREYGNWRIRSFGTVAAGDHTLVERRRTQREAAERLRTNSDYYIEAGYAYLFEKAPAALYASFNSHFYGVNFYFAGSDFWSIGLFMNYNRVITAADFAFIPYIRFGFSYINDQEYKDHSDGFFDFSSSIFAQAGLKVTSTYVPGLFAGVGFQYNFNLFNMMGDFDNPMRMGLAITAGYAF
jgi:serine protease Do